MFPQSCPGAPQTVSPSSWKPELLSSLASSSPHTTQGCREPPKPSVSRRQEPVPGVRQDEMSTCNSGQCTQDTGSYRRKVQGSQASVDSHRLSQTTKARVSSSWVVSSLTPTSLGDEEQKSPREPTVAPRDEKGPWQLHPASPLAHVRPRGICARGQVLASRAGPCPLLHLSAPTVTDTG